MPQTVQQVLLYSLALAIPVFLGGLLPLSLPKIRKHLSLGLALSAGLMFGAAFLHLFPRAYSLIGETASFWMIAGFLFLYTIEKFVTMHICEALDCEVHTIGISAAIGLSLHAMTDGVALGTGVLSEGLALVVFLSILFHKLPEAFVLTSALLHAEFKRATVIGMNLLLMLVVPLSGLLIVSSVGTFNPSWSGSALAFSAGTFLHISLSDLLPEVHHHSTDRYKVFGALLLGLGSMALLHYWIH